MALSLLFLVLSVLMVEESYGYLQRVSWSLVGRNLQQTLASVSSISARVIPIDKQFYPVSDGLDMEVLISKPNLAKASPLIRKPPLVFIHGSFHSAWCFAENFMPHFSSLGYECYALSLRGTQGTKLPANCQSKSVKVEDHVADVYSCLQKIVQQQPVHPVVIGHSFGGMVILKLLEKADFRQMISGVALIGSVPPSGNFAMTFRRSPWETLKILYGFVLKTATRYPSICRDLFFDAYSVSDIDLLRYMQQFQADSKIGLDLSSLNKVLPSITSMNITTKQASWLPSSILNNLNHASHKLGSPGAHDSASGVFVPARIVMGGSKDFLVDIPALHETAIYLGLPQADILPHVYHDVMLGSKWPQTASLLEKWLNQIEIMEISPSSKD